MGAGIKLADQEGEAQAAGLGVWGRSSGDQGFIDEGHGTRGYVRFARGSRGPGTSNILLRAGQLDGTTFYMNMSETGELLSELSCELAPLLPALPLPIYFGAQAAISRILCVLEHGPRSGPTIRRD
eukprot:1783533-Prymnesium_polylepis.1